jgi:iron complex transport system ATP-binding protein
VSWRTPLRTVLGPLDLAISSGECVAVIGPNGAGKTTLLRLLAGLLHPSTGGLEWQGRPFRALSRRQLARHIAYLPQSRPLRVPFTVEELVLLGRYPYLDAWQVAPGQPDFAAVGRALASTGSEPLRHRALDELSGGERQLAYLASALAQEPQLLLLDEPTTHLDPRHQVELVAVLRQLRASPEGPTLVLTTHDLDFAAALADRVVALSAGRILADGPAAQVLTPEVLAELFDATFSVETVAGQLRARVALGGGQRSASA